MKEEYLKSILKKIKLDVTFIFREGIIGDPEEKDIKELKTEMKKMKNEIIKKNIDITKIITEKFMEENYKNMKAKLVNNQYEDILDYKDDIEQFVEFCLNKCPQGPGRDNIIYEYLILQIIDNADILYNNNISEKEKILEENDVNIMEIKK
jgi:hypothetical protein